MSFHITFSGDEGFDAGFENVQKVPVIGPQGPQGDPGVSPVVTVTDISGGHRVTITDEDHPLGISFDVLDGDTGATPKISAAVDQLKPGSTPYVNVTGTDEHPMLTFGIPDGEPGQDGKNGVDGKNGTDGKDGADGVSPEVTVATITGGHSVTITDADHPGGQTFNVMDGEQGEPGTTDFNDLQNKPNYALSHSIGGAAEMTVAIPYGEVDSTSTNTAYTVTVPGINELKDGVVCYIRNDVVTSTTNCTINVNGLGAKPMYLSSADASRVAAQFTSATTWLLIYNESRVEGGCWDLYQGMVSSNTIGYQVRTNSTALPLSDKCYRYRLLFTSADGTEFVPANADTQTSAAKSHTTCTTPIDPFGSIFYYGTTTAKSAGDKPSDTILWQQYVITLGYSFNSTNAALTLTANAPVYIRCTPNADGSAVLDYFTQALPTTNDGKIYIFLGVAIDATTVEMQLTHPVYYHNGTGLRLWTGG